jgi:hypothetical protein
MRRLEMSFDEVNAELQVLANEVRENQIDVAYEEFLNEMYYYWSCDQWERDMEILNDY